MPRHRRARRISWAHPILYGLVTMTLSIPRTRRGRSAQRLEKLLAAPSPGPVPPVVDIEDARAAARAAGLRYASDREPGIRRIRSRVPS